MGEKRWFYRNAEEWIAFAEHLKLMPCPHCQLVGTLVRHGFLYGYDQTNPQRKTPRARRIFCSNRNARLGCGRTFSVWIADKIRRLSLTTGALWRFLQHTVASGIAEAIRAANPVDLRDFLLRELDRAGLGHNTFTRPALDLIVRSADGVLRKARNLGVACLIEAVRSAHKAIDIDNVNRVLMQPHWQKEVDLVDY